ncbi:MAG TPA: methyltransferase domain-containing protein [Thermoanaerobaculia bacterium]|nr:methyltransferase domain-containing protein [Thermoanaerobaculia bacterium]
MSDAASVKTTGNLDPRVVAGFGDEWTRFDQTGMTAEETQRAFQEYFRIFPWATLPPDPVGFDLGCGSGRWARLVAPRVGTLHCIDASAEALNVAKEGLGGATNVVFHHASVDDIPLPDSSADFGYTLGVLHHVPDTQAGLVSCVSKLKPGAPLLVYLYYSLDNRPAWYRGLWRTSDVVRRVISRAPHALRASISNVFATIVYWPLARLARLVEKFGGNARNMPLAYYRRRTFYTMRTDALDRFGTRLEQRFSRDEIRSMMERAGLENIEFSDSPPYWVGFGRRRR